QDEVIDHRRRRFERGELRLQVLRLAGAATEEQADADLPRLAVLTDPVGDADDAIGGMLTERPFRHYMLQPPGADLHAMLVANLQKRPETRLELACGAGNRAFRRQLPRCLGHRLIP